MKKSTTNPYEDIIDLPHHTSEIRGRMPMQDRAAQFSPFAALTGYEAVIRETGRLTEEKINLDEDMLELLDRKILLLKEQSQGQAEVCLTCFKADPRKAGGAYVKIRGVVKKVDEFERMIFLNSGEKIPLDDVTEIVMPEELA